jgi:hypothetical protein
MVGVYAPETQVPLNDYRQAELLPLGVDIARDNRGPNSPRIRGKSCA